jgi:hypothetical protein
MNRLCGRTTRARPLPTTAAGEDDIARFFYPLSIWEIDFRRRRRRRRRTERRVFYSTTFFVSERDRERERG